MPVNKIIASSREGYSFNDLSRRYGKYYTYIQPIITDPQVRSYFSLIASLLLTAFLIIFALSPTINVVIGLKRQIDDQKATITALDQKISALVEAQMNYNVIEKDLPIFDKALPITPIPHGIIADVHKIASSSGVGSLSLQVQALPLSYDLPLEKSPLGIPAVKFLLSAKSASKDNLRKFLGSLENQLRYMRAETFSLVPSDGQQSYSIDTLNMGYYFH